MGIVVKSNAKAIIKELGAFERDVPFIMKEAANDIAFDALKKIKQEVNAKLHITTNRIPNAWRVKKATKQRPYAELWVDEWSWQYKVLRHHYYGGDRLRKGLEKRLIRYGYMNPSDILTTPPGRHPSRYMINEIVAQLKIANEAGYFANETERSRKRRERIGKTTRFFIIPRWKRSHLAPGIYARKDGYDKPICIFRIASKPHYKKRLDAERIIKKVIERRFEAYVAKAVERAWKFRKRYRW